MKERKFWGEDDLLHFGHVEFEVPGKDQIELSGNCLEIQSAFQERSNRYKFARQSHVSQ